MGDLYWLELLIAIGILIFTIRREVIRHRQLKKEIADFMLHSGSPVYNEKEEA
jgi:hypothetical protein